MTFPIDKTEYEWERFRFSEERTSDSEWRSDELTPENLRRRLIWRVANQETRELLDGAFGLWAADREQIERLREERDQLRALLSTVLVDAYEHIGAETICMVGARKALAATEDKRDD